MIKDLYIDDLDFGTVFRECLNRDGATSVHQHYIHDGFLFKASHLCIPRCSIRTLLVLEAHGGGLMGHFGVAKTLGMLKEHFMWPKMRSDVERHCASCVTCHKAKLTTHPYGLYTPLPIADSPWEHVSMDFV